MSEQPDIENRETEQTLPQPAAGEEMETTTQDTSPQPQPTEESSSEKADHTIERTRASGMWTAIAVAAVVLLLLLIFILQNLQSVTVGFFGFDGRLPLGVALLLAAVGGALVVVVTGAARIVQLRRLARRHRRQDASA